MKRSKKGKILAVIAVLILAGLYYYVTLPAINIHSSGFWAFLIALLAVILAYVAFRGTRLHSVNDLRDLKELGRRKVIKVLLGLIGILVLILAVGTVLSSPIVNAKKYQQLLEPKTGDFAEDIDEIALNNIPLLDKDSAELLGNRKMGSMVDMVSQFEVSSLYSQINYPIIS